MSNPVTVRLFGHHAHWEGVEEGAGQGIHFIVNGWTLSAQAGFGHYCSSDPSRVDGLILTNQLIRPDCEIALWADTDGFIKLGNHDSVIGWVPWGIVIELVHWLAHQVAEPSETAVRNKVCELVRENE